MQKLFATLVVATVLLAACSGSTNAVEITDINVSSEAGLIFLDKDGISVSTLSEMENGNPLITIPELGNNEFVIIFGRKGLFLGSHVIESCYVFAISGHTPFEATIEVLRGGAYYYEVSHLDYPGAPYLDVAEAHRDEIEANVESGKWSNNLCDGGETTPYYMLPP